MTEKYVVAWKSKVTGDISYGETKRPKAEIEDLCEWLNEVWPSLYHWAVKASDVPRQVAR